ncbi:hypothetical protein [Roseimicrobium sp. ORNL1]|uniref:hypothetical protein n=1 Tax=Roseimicrobium sp. ORNL1 TaxID=2711231 RepID=UPI0013E111E4|nr:hypothetical protein [Roseimicrobium sp. ORNL1]QIF04828.1 hypothetical protein G5S37_26035 [Roseimicrobium sp. ORNL1]
MERLANDNKQPAGAAFLRCKILCSYSECRVLAAHLTCIVAAYLFAAASAWAQQVRLPDRTEVMVPSCGYDSCGRVDISLPLASISLPGRSLPVAIRYIPSLSMAGALPYGWQLPILDACAVQESEETCLVLMPDGEYASLARDAKADAYHSPNGKWQAKVNGSHIELTSGEDKLKYEEGRIRSMERKGEFELHWIYGRSGLLEKIVNGAGSTVLAIGQSREGLVHHLTLTPSEQDKRVALRYTKIPENSRVAAKVFNESFPNVLEEIILPGNRVVTVTNNKSDSGQVSMEWKCPEGGALYNRYFSWNDKTGNILSVDKAQIETTFPQGATSPQVVQIEDGKRTVVQKARANQSGTIFTFEPDGRIRKDFYGLRPDGSALMLRKQTETDPAGNTLETYRARFGSDGLLNKDEAGEWTRVLEDGVYRVYHKGKLIRSY